MLKNKYAILENGKLKKFEFTDEEVKSKANIIGALGFIDKNGVVYKQLSQFKYIYANNDMYKKGYGVCYIPEDSDVGYTKDDFLDVCEGNEVLSDYLYNSIEDGSPSDNVKKLSHFSTPEFINTNGNIRSTSDTIVYLENCGILKMFNMAKLYKINKKQILNSISKIYCELN